MRIIEVKAVWKRIDCFVTGPTITEIYTLSLHDALPISLSTAMATTYNVSAAPPAAAIFSAAFPLNLCARIVSPLVIRSEEHTSELKSRFDLVCRLLLEKKKATYSTKQYKNEMTNQ